MHELIGRQYQYRLMEGEIKTVTDVKNNLVIFDDGGRVPLERLDEMFEGIAGQNDNGMSPAAARQILTQSQDVIDPNAFFNPTSHNDLLKQLKKQAENIDITNVKEQVNTTNHTITNTEPEPPVKRLHVERTDTGKVIETREENAAPQGADFLKKMKRNHDVEISLRFVHRIPKLDFIKMMDENFDQGVLNYLIDDITEKILASQNMIQTQVRDQLHQLVHGKKDKKRKKNESNKETAEQAE